MHRWTARFLLLLMLVPAFGPLALAGVAPPEGMHCMRRPVTASPASAERAMHCHHGGPQSATQNVASPASSEASFRSLDCCCQHCDCCRSSKTSEWARPACNHFSFASLLIEPALLASAAPRLSAPLIGADSARAPPRR